MTKFGKFFGSIKKPSQVVEGRSLCHEGEYVKVIDDNDACVAIVRLQPGEMIRQVTAADESDEPRKRMTEPTPGRVWNWT